MNRGQSRLSFFRAHDDKKVEDRTIGSLMDLFVQNLNVDDKLLDKCLSKELITEEAVSRIGGALRDGHRSDAVKDLLLSIKENPHNYLKTFCGVLDNSKSNFYLVSRLKEEYSQQSKAAQKSWPGKFKNNSLPGYGSLSLESKDSIDGMPTARERWEEQEKNIKTKDHNKPQPRDLEICSFKYKSIQDNYVYLTTALPIDDLLSVLYCKKVITIREKKQIERGDLRENKVCYLLDDIISPALKVGHGLKFDMLVKEMESSKDTTANHLAKKLMQGVDKQIAADKSSTD